MAEEAPPDIPYDKNFELVPGRVDEPMPGVRRVLCNNPSPFTFKGTVSYIVGSGKVAIIDPGPANDAHIAALLDAVRGETVTAIFVTHTHRDHSPAVPKIKAATGATVYAEGPHRPARPLNVGEVVFIQQSGKEVLRAIARFFRVHALAADEGVDGIPIAGAQPAERRSGDFALWVARVCDQRPGSSREPWRFCDDLQPLGHARCPLQIQDVHVRTQFAVSIHPSASKGATALGNNRPPK